MTKTKGHMQTEKKCATTTTTQKIINTRTKVHAMSSTWLQGENIRSATI